MIWVWGEKKTRAKNCLKRAKKKKKANLVDHEDAVGGLDAAKGNLAREAPLQEIGHQEDDACGDEVLAVETGHDGAGQVRGGGRRDRGRRHLGMEEDEETWKE